MVVKLKKGAPKVVTANDLRNGLALFMKSDGAWTGNINEALVLQTDEEMDQALNTGLQAETDNIVIGPYLIDIEHMNDEIKPVHIREYMRATGPSVRKDLWRQDS